MKNVVGGELSYLELTPDQYWNLEHLPDYLKTQEICEKVVEKEPSLLHGVPEHLKAQQMCEKAVEKGSSLLHCVPDHFKIQKMCEKAVNKYLLSLKHVPDWFVAQQQIDVWRDSSYYCNDYRMIK